MKKRWHRRHITEAIVKACHGKVTVPMAGRVESLNVAVAAGIILFEAARQRRERKGTKAR